EPAVPSTGSPSTLLPSRRASRAAPALGRRNSRTRSSSRITLARSVDDDAAGQIGDGAGQRAGAIRGEEDCRVGELGERGRALAMGSALDQGEELLRVDAHRLGVQPEDDVDRAGLGEPGRAQADRAHALRGELGGERAREALHRRPRGAHPIDVSFNATGIPQVGIQGIPLTSLPVESFALPIATYLRSNFLTARAAARRMVEKKSGAIL